MPGLAGQFCQMESVLRLSLNKMSNVIGWFLVTCPDQIQMYPDRDKIPQLLPARDVLLRYLKENI